MDQSFSVGDYVVEPELNRIRRGSETVALQAKVMQVLVFLARYPKKVLPKERIMRAVWSDTFVTDDVLTHAVSELRKAFGDDPRDPRFIQTIPRKGYRLIAPVFEVESESRYRITERIGRGAMGDVYLAEDSLLKRKVALKFVLREKEEDDTSRRRLRREALAAAALDHPFICKVYDTGQLDGRTFIAMEYVRGRTLKERLAEGPMAPRQALAVAIEIAEALELSHSKGIVHRDLKPSNVILTAQGHVKITDFGIAKRLIRDEGDTHDLGHTLTQTGATPGTVPYMSPEQLSGDEITPASDVFSLGVVLYEMLTGRNPFWRGGEAETTTSILRDAPAPIPESIEAFAPGVGRLLLRMLAKDPRKRPVTGAAVLAFLKGLRVGAMSLAQEMALKTPTEADLEAHPRDASAGPDTLGDRDEGRASPAETGVRKVFSAVAVLIVVLVGAYFLSAILIQTPDSEKILVAVLAPVIREEPTESDEFVAFLVQDAILNRLALVNGVEPVEGPSPAEGATPAEIQRDLVVDEVLLSRVNCQEQECQVSLRRLRDGKTVRGRPTFPVSSDPERALEANDAVTAQVLQLFVEEAEGQQFGSEVDHKDYLVYVDLKRRSDRGERLGNEDLEQAESLTTTSPRFLPIFLLAANVARYSNQVERALSTLRQAEALFPNDPRPVYARVNLEIAQNDFEEAEAALVRLGTISPGDHRTLSARRYFLDAQGRLKEAVLTADELVQRRPTWQNLWALANLQRQLGRVASARHHLEDLNERFPDNPWVINSLAILEMQFGDLAQAEKHLRGLVAGDPSEQELGNMCWALYLAGRFNEARKYCTDALQRDRENAVSLFQMAAIMGALGSMDESRALYSEALTILQSQTRTDPVSRLIEARCLVGVGRIQDAHDKVSDVLRDDVEVWGLYQSAAIYALISEHTDPEKRAQIGLEALVHMARALGKGMHPRWFLIPDFKPLGDTTQFKEVLASTYIPIEGE